MANTIFTIEARSEIVIGFGRHDFWVLKDSAGNLVAELDGLAYNRIDQKVVQIGLTSNDSLRVFQTEP